ncbi:hypothetical protein KR222_000780 [Zaprionus bogoriensis]|nr:hypothetical protein KR222_000780 [Zaprionus bogoriensis]
MLLLPEPAHTLRIKRADSQANASDSKSSISAPPFAAVVAGAISGAAKPPQEQLANATGTAKVEAVAQNAATTAANADATSAPSVAADAAAAAAAGPPAAAVTPAASSSSASSSKLEDSLPLELSDRMHRAKRRMSLADESLLMRAPAHRGHHRGGAIAVNAAAAAAAAGAAGPPPYVYFNKMISPDGKQELKEFQLLAPNMVIESLQHDMNYGPVPDVGGVLLLNADNAALNGHPHGLAKAKHHGHKHAAKAPALALPPFLYMLQQMLQPSNMNLNMNMEPMERNHNDPTFYQFLDSSNSGVMDHLLAERDRDNELLDGAGSVGSGGGKEKDKERDMDGSELQKLDEKSKEAIEAMMLPNRKEDELLVSCPIHHEHHASNNGDVIDDDVVLVNECHIV